MDQSQSYKLSMWNIQCYDGCSSINTGRRFQICVSVFY